ARLIMTSRAKRLGGPLHCIVPHRTMHVKIDKSGREIIAFEIDSSPAHRRCWCANGGDHSAFDDEFQSIPNSIRKDQTSVPEDHHASLRNSPARVNTPSEKPDVCLNRKSRSSGFSIC